MVNNKVILMGRMTKDAAMVEPKAEGQGKIAHFTLAVDKLRKKQEESEDEAGAYFIRCTAFEKQAEFLEQYGKKGVKFAVEGHLSTGRYEKNEATVYTTDVIVENIQFCESKKKSTEDTFFDIPSELEEEMPFK